MIKTAIATLAATAAVVAPSAALAGPYVNIEANSSFTGSNYTGTTTDAHVGYAGTAGEAVSWGVQAGPSFVVTDGGESDTVLSGKVYGSVAATEKLSVYGELSFAGGIDDADNGYGTKAGVTYSF
mgnify:CR=1 FL=1|jgi:hypothetical protein|tara:strand:+ start:412 stop:786 length:375 start_codon:yes stop_codon:yes gene_type:complete